jgi:hypothetical protein
VATAVRTFDRAAPGRRWLKRQRRRAHFRRWLQGRQDDGTPINWLGLFFAVLLLAAALVFGFELGYRAGFSAASLTAQASRD